MTYWPISTHWWIGNCRIRLQRNVNLSRRCIAAQAMMMTAATGMMRL
jgi:hypothetical protein